MIVQVSPQRLTVALHGRRQRAGGDAETIATWSVSRSATDTASEHAYWTAFLACPSLSHGSTLFRRMQNDLR